MGSKLRRQGSNTQNIIKIPVMSALSFCVAVADSGVDVANGTDMSVDVGVAALVTVRLMMLVLMLMMVQVLIRMLMLVLLLLLL